MFKTIKVTTLSDKRSIYLNIDMIGHIYEIKEEKVMVDINSRNISYYKSIGYDLKMSFSDKKKIEIPVSQVSKFSKIKIT